MELARTKFAYDQTVSHLAVHGKNSPIESYLVQFLLVLFYSEVEEKIKEIAVKRLSVIDDKKVTAFLTKMNEGMFKRIKKSEINDLLHKFDCGDGDIIAEKMPNRNLEPYFSAINNRHKVSHSTGSTMTLAEFSEAIPCAEAILEAVQQLLDA